MKRGYTLVHLLLVVIIVAFVGVVLGMKFQAMKSVSRDTSRVSAIKELTTALSAYYFDYNEYPGKWATTISSAIGLTPSYLALLPKEPLIDQIIPDFWVGAIQPGHFAFLPGDSKHRGNLLVMAKIENPWFANFQVGWAFSSQTMTSETIDWDSIESRICESDMIKVNAGMARKDHPCEFENNEDLRYIIVKHNS